MIWAGFSDDLGWIWRGYTLGWIMRMPIGYQTGSGKECKKMQKKCKKIQKLLHISKKSSTFAADMGIVPCRTIKYNRVMKKECIFKAWKGSEWWYLYRLHDAMAPNGCIYRVYCGRKWYDKITWYDYEVALGQLLGFCVGLGRVIFRRNQL